MRIYILEFFSLFLNASQAYYAKKRGHFQRIILGKQGQNTCAKVIECLRLPVQRNGPLDKIQSLHSFTFFWRTLKWQEILSRNTSVFPPETSQGVTALIFHILPSIKQNLTARKVSVDYK